MSSNIRPHSEMFRKRIEHYSYAVSETIGKGYSSVVYRGVDDRTANPVAIKVINLKEIKQSALPQLLHAEIHIMQSLHHPNILRCEQVFITVNNCYIVTELCQEGDLATYLKTHKRLKESEAVGFMKQIAQGVNYLKKSNVIHRDIKPANIFMQGGMSKIGDFGFARQEKEVPKERCRIGSPLYMSPKALLELDYTHQNDIWAMGVMFYEMMEGRPPWNVNSEQDLKDIYSKQVDIKLKYTVSPQIAKIIKGCLQFDEANRISIEEIIGLLSEIPDPPPVSRASVKRIVRYQSTTSLTPLSFASNEKKLDHQNSVKTFVTNFQSAKKVAENKENAGNPFLNKLEAKKEEVSCENAESIVKNNYRILKWLINYCRYVSKLFPRVQNNLICWNHEKKVLFQFMADVLITTIDKLFQLDQLREQFEHLGVRNYEEFKKTVWYTKVEAVTKQYHLIYRNQLKKIASKLPSLPMKHGKHNQIAIPSELPKIVGEIIVDAAKHEHNIALKMLVNVVWVNNNMDSMGVKQLMGSINFEAELQNMPEKMETAQLQDLLFKKTVLVEMMHNVA